MSQVYRSAKFIAKRFLWHPDIIGLLICTSIEKFISDPKDKSICIHFLKTNVYVLYILSVYHFKISKNKV